MINNLVLLQATMMWNVLKTDSYDSSGCCMFTVQPIKAIGILKSI